jgi:F-type H+-transporting ATPase subunit delta
MTEPDLKETFNPGVERVASVYAEAVYSEAEAQHALEQVREELHGILALTEADEAMRSFLLGGVVGRTVRDATIREAFGDRVHPVVFNFLLVLSDHDRLNLLKPIVSTFEEMSEEKSGKVRATVVAAAPLPEDQRERLTNQLREITRRDPILEVTIDPELLGGLIVQVGDWRYDASVRRQLEVLRDQLIESSSHEIQVGRDRFGSA